jgi:uncharacterized protein
MRTVEDILASVATVPDFAGVTVTSPNTSGNFATYPLHVAAAWGDCEAIRLLVSAGAVVNQPGEHGFTPLMEAVAQCHSDAAMELISLGAAPTRNDAGEIPSEHAAVLGHQHLAARLRSMGF